MDKPKKERIEFSEFEKLRVAARADWYAQMKPGTKLLVKWGSSLPEYAFKEMKVLEVKRLGNDVWYLCQYNDTYNRKTLFLLDPGNIEFYYANDAKAVELIEKRKNLLKEVEKIENDLCPLWYSSGREVENKLYQEYDVYSKYSR